LESPEGYENKKAIFIAGMKKEEKNYGTANEGKRNHYPKHENIAL
jgi:hypothetical protein